MLVAALLQLPAPLLTRYLLDHVIPSGDFSRLHWFALLLVAVVAGYHAASYAFHLATIENRVRVERAIREGLFTSVLAAAPAAFEGERKGYLQSRLDADVDRIGDLFLDTFLNLALHVLTLIFGVGLLVYLNPFLAAVSLVSLPFFVWTSKRYAGRLYAASGARQEAWAQLRGKLVELLAMGPALKLHGRETEAKGHFREALQQALREDRGLGFLQARASAVANVAGAVLPLFVLWYGVWAIMRGQFTLGSFLAFHAALGYLYGPVEALVGLGFGLASGTAAGMRLVAIAGLPREQERFGSKPLPPRFSLRVQHLEVRVAEGRVVGPLSFSLQPGQWVALVGPTGSGKSSVLKALVGFRAVEAGAVTVNGEPLHDFSLPCIRERIALVPQDPVLLAGTVEDNLRLFQPKAGSWSWEQALWHAALDLDKLSQGLRTPVAEGGASLSGGERQRLALACALLRKPAVLLLDEVTAGLDVDTEHQLLERLRQLPWNPAILWVTHRAAALRFVSQVVSMEAESPGSQPSAVGSAMG